MDRKYTMSWTVFSDMASPIALGVTMQGSKGTREVCAREVHSCGPTLIVCSGRYRAGDQVRPAGVASCAAPLGVPI